MQTECNLGAMGFSSLEKRSVTAAFDGGLVTSHSGALLLQATDRHINLVRRFAGCLRHARRQDLIEHDVVTLVGQRIFGLALGYEDLNDHDQLRHDPMMALLAGKLSARRLDCAPVAGKSTLNRLETARSESSRYHKISYNASAIGSLFVDIFFGLAGNDRLVAHVAAELKEAEQEAKTTGKPARRFKDFTWTTRKSWACKRRVIAKAEWTGNEPNPRFIVTSLKPDAGAARELYERVYCARGDMENQIKECQGDLFADSTSSSTMAANQLRLWFASMAYVRMCALRRLALAGTQFAVATCATLREKLLKVGALVSISVRRFRVAMPSAYPWKHEWGLAHRRLTAA